MQSVSQSVEFGGIFGGLTILVAILAERPELRLQQLLAVSMFVPGE